MHHGRHLLPEFVPESRGRSATGADHEVVLGDDYLAMLPARGRIGRAIGAGPGEPTRKKLQRDLRRCWDRVAQSRNPS